MSTRNQWNGDVIADLAVVPIGTGSTSVSSEVAHVEKILAKFPVRTSIHPNGTNIQGSWDDISAAIKAIHTELHESGLARINCNMRWGTRTDKPYNMEDKVKKVEQIMRSQD